MLKSILNLNGAQELNKKEQKGINGGGRGLGAGPISCSSVEDCENSGFCTGQVFCVPVNGGICFGVSGTC